MVMSMMGLPEAPPKLARRVAMVGDLGEDILYGVVSRDGRGGGWRKEGWSAKLSADKRCDDGVGWSRVLL